MLSRPVLGTALMLAALAFSLWPAAAGSVRLNPSAVVELFTSQGCSSCPPADALLSELAEREDVVALAYHVDYWDYIGWPDTFGAEANSDRQRAYAAGWGSSRIYTPQMVINGTTDVVGSKQTEVRKALDQAELWLPVDLSAEGDMLTISIDGHAGLEDAMVWLVTYLDNAEVAIERGENEGRSIRYSQVVTGRQALGVWESDSGAHIKMPLAEILADHSNGVAILVQQESEGRPGPIIGAALYQH